jgi:hypothetical protein
MHLHRTSWAMTGWNIFSYNVVFINFHYSVKRWVMCSLLISVQPADGAKFVGVIDTVEQSICTQLGTDDFECTETGSHSHRFVGTTDHMVTKVDYKRFFFICVHCYRCSIQPQVFKYCEICPKCLNIHEIFLCASSAIDVPYNLKYSNTVKFALNA